jgi:hypothetical protein
MNFQDVVASVNLLSHELELALNMPVVDTITVEEPRSPEDELHFVRLIHYAFILINEAGQPVFRELLRLLKNANPQQARHFGEAKRDIDALRTWTSHNLAGDGANERTLKLAKAWLLTHAGNSTNWTACCRALCETLVGMLRSLQEVTQSTLLSREDADSTRQQILFILNDAWPVHVFDEHVSLVASNNGLMNFNAVEFRKARIEEWKKIGRYFSAREDGIAAIKRAIAREIEFTFGKPLEG